MSERHLLIEDYPMGYRGLTLNGHRNSSGALVRANIEDTLEVTLLDFSALSVRDQLEGLHVDSGADVGVASKEFRRLTIRGLIKGSTAKLLEDRVVALFNAFDIEEAMRTAPSTEGLSLFDFYCPATTLPAGYTSPVREAFWARPRGFPVVYERKSSGLAVPFAAELTAADPRRYCYTALSVVFSAGAGWAKTMPNWASGQGVPVWPTVTIVMADAGDDELTISDGTTSFELDMSAEGAGTYVVDMKKGDILEGSDFRDDLRASDVDTFLAVPPGGSTWTVTNTTNVTSITAAYRPARS